MRLPIYLDHNATTPVDPAVLAALLPYLADRYGNPSSGHVLGQEAHGAVDLAREQVAGLLGCAPAEIIVTGTGSEANNLAILGVALAAGQRRHIITSVVEHPAVARPCVHLEAVHGFRISRLPVNGAGQVDPDDVRRAITTDTALITIMHAQNEVGTLQPIAEIGRIAREHGVPLHTDSAQSVGKVPTRVDDLGVDLLTVAGHKLYAPKGIGALYVRAGTRLNPVIHGASQEGGLRPGTENVAFIVALGAACALAAGRLAAEQARLAGLRDQLQALLCAGAEASVNGHPEQRLPGTLSISFAGVVGDELLARVPEVAASTGSACHTGSPEPSAVLLAMGVPRERALSTLRLSLGRQTTPEQVAAAAGFLGRGARELRSACDRRGP